MSIKIGDKVRILSRTIGRSLKIEELGAIVSVIEIRGDGSGYDTDNCIVVDSKFSAFFAPKDLKLVDLPLTKKFYKII